MLRCQVQMSSIPVQKLKSSAIRNVFGYIIWQYAELVMEIWSGMSYTNSPCMNIYEIQLFVQCRTLFKGPKNWLSNWRERIFVVLWCSKDSRYFTSILFLRLYHNCQEGFKNLLSIMFRKTRWFRGLAWRDRSGRRRRNDIWCHRKTDCSYIERYIWCYVSFSRCVSPHACFLQYVSA